jgi:hypothetical protein
MANLWADFIDVIINPDGTDEELEDIVFELLVHEEKEDEQEQEVEDEENPMTADGSRRRKVKREDYARRQKFKKMENDPATHLQWMQWIKEPEIKVFFS